MTTDFDLDTDLDAEIDEPGPEVSMTDPAIARLLHLIESAGDPPVTGIRLQVARRTQDGFEHLLTMVDQGREPEDDYELDFDGLAIYVHGDHAEDLDGLAVHWEYKGEGVNGFEFDNPNPRWRDPLAERIQVLFDEQVNPAIAAHGGAVDLLGVEGKIAYVRMGGGCQGCGTGERHPARGHRGHDEGVGARDRRDHGLHRPRSRREPLLPALGRPRSRRPRRTASRAESSLSFVCGGLRPPHPHPGRARALCSC